MESHLIQVLVLGHCTTAIYQHRRIRRRTLRGDDANEHEESDQTQHLFFVRPQLSRRLEDHAQWNALRDS